MSSLGPVLLLFLTLPSSGQLPADDPSADFLFGAPKGTLGFRGGVFLANANSDVYRFFEETLTIEEGDFDAPGFGIDVGLAVHSRFDVLFSFDFTRAGITSEDRDFVDENDLPIVQETSLTILPFTGSIKAYLGPRGRQVSRYAFVPSRVRPYAGVGGGFLWYELKQEGDFVDRSDLSIFTAVVRSDGFGLAAQAFGGIEVAVGTRWFLSFEGRYLWADSELSGDFVGFEPIDLSGLKVTAGFNVSF
jgi:hypothetical protein